MTIAYDPSSGRWKSRYSFDTSSFNVINNNMLSFDTNSFGENLCYVHDQNSPRNTFYGVTTESSITLSFNAQPSTNKVYNSISLEGANLGASESDLITNLSPEQEQRNDSRVYEGFVQRGGIYYGGITKVQTTDNEANLKLVGEITRARVTRNNDYPEIEINGGNFPFNGIQATDAWWTYLFLDLIPSPHYRSLDSATSNNTPGADNVISKYYLGFASGGQINLRSPRITLNGEDIEAGLLLGSILNIGNISQPTVDTYSNISGAWYNTDVNPKIGDTICIRVFPAGAVEQIETEVLPETLASAIVAYTVNNYLEGNGQRLFLYKITDDRIDGSDPIGQYADLTLNLGTQDFELYAVNAHYSTTSLDHSK